MKIRPAIVTDLSFIEHFNINLAMETEGLELSPLTVKAGVSAVLMDPAKGVYYVAETPEGDIAGQLLITYEWSDWRNGTIWWIQSVYIKKPFRGQRIFTRLFEAVQSLAEADGEVRAIRLYVEKHNQTALLTYKKMGMTERAYAVMEKEIVGK